MDPLASVTLELVVGATVGKGPVGGASTTPKASPPALPSRGVLDLTQLYAVRLALAQVWCLLPHCPESA